LGNGAKGEGSRAENGIRLLYTNFGSSAPLATLFSNICTSIPIGYVYGEIDYLIGFLRECHERRLNAKDKNYLFSPAIFDPARSADTNRGMANIVHLQNVILDFENGELRPEELPNLFPGSGR
jgi:hypothetical protein